MNFCGAQESVTFLLFKVWSMKKHHRLTPRKLLEIYKLNSISELLN